MVAPSYIYNLPFLEEIRSCCKYLLYMHSALGWLSSWIICLLKKNPHRLQFMLVYVFMAASDVFIIRLGEQVTQNESQGQLNMERVDFGLRTRNASLAFKRRCSVHGRNIHVIIRMRKRGKIEIPVCIDFALTFKNRASYTQDGRIPTLQMLHFIYFFNKYKY